MIFYIGTYFSEKQEVSSKKIIVEAIKVLLYLHKDNGTVKRPEISEELGPKLLYNGTEVMGNVLARVSFSKP